MAKRLAGATSPYLLQHAGNPVDWWPWSDAAFTEARRRDVPVLLSVGYAACHWCHVMAHESFEHDQTAALMNENLVCIKVDREERPDVDSVYMTATQAMTGQGGWPMTVFLTADREPFYCGTYFPRDYLTRLIQAIAKAWRDDRAGVTGQARRVTAALAQASARARAPDAAVLFADLAGAAGDAGGTGPEPAAADSRMALARLTESAVRALSAGYDEAAGGFGGAPKFPPSTVLEFLLRHAASARQPAAALAMEMVNGTAEAMARGGMYDQLGGGFARYSTDAGWVIPHFEKMLYDNALLARVYAHWWRQSGAALGRRIAEETCDWMIRELGTAEGGLASSLDADSDGTEGAFYVWTPDQLAGVLGTDDAEYAAKIFSVADPATFEGGSSVLQLRADPADQPRYQRVRAALLEARAARVRPATDGKVVAAWNGLAIAALAETGLLLGRPDLVATARQAAGLLARVHLAGGRLDRTSRDGRSGGTAGVLEDYACVADGFLVLSGVTGEARWLRLAGELLDTALDRFADQDGRFYDTADDGEQLIYRPADPADGPSPSGTFAVAGALLSYAALTGSARHREAAAAALSALPDMAARYPRAAGWGLVVAEALGAGPAEIAVVGPPGDERTRALHLAAIRHAPPGAVLAIGDGSSPKPGVPLLAGRGLVDGRPAAYVCRNFACQLPVTEPDQLAALLRA